MNSPTWSPRIPRWVYANASVVGGYTAAPAPAAAVGVETQVAVSGVDTGKTLVLLRLLLLLVLLALLGLLPPPPPPVLFSPRLFTLLPPGLVPPVVAAPPPITHPLTLVLTLPLPLVVPPLIGEESDRGCKCILESALNNEWVGDN